MAMADDLITAKNNLKAVLGSSFNGYVKLLRKWFCQNISKQEFDAQARLLFTPKSIRCHNDFLAILLTKCHIRQSVKRPNSPTPTGFKALKKIKRSASASANLNSEKSFQNRSLKPTDVVEATSALASASSNGIKQILCSKEGILPDPSMIHGRLLVICWENELEDVDEMVLPLVIYALRDAIKNLIHGCVELRRSHVVHDGRFQHLFGVDDDLSCDNFALPNVRHRIVGETMELKQSGLMSTVVCRPRNKITLLDLYQALKIRPNLIPSHSLFSCVIERILCSLKGFSSTDRKNHG